MARVLLTDEAINDLRVLDTALRRIAFNGLLKLRDEPGMRGLSLGSMSIGNLTGYRKLVVGNRELRIVYEVTDAGHVVVVWVIGKRADSEVYSLAVARLGKHPDPRVRALGNALGPLLAARGAENP